MTQTTMKAMLQDRYGPPDVLRLREIPVPPVGPGDVRVRVKAAGAHRGDTHLMMGLPLIARLALGFRRPRVAVRGMDLSGVVEAVGGEVTGFHPGDAVFGWGDGTFAEVAVAPERNLLPKPSRLTFEEAATVPMSGIAALQALRDKARLQPGQTVLITGASGGVGTFAVQIARALGADVTAVCSTPKLDFVRSLGAAEAIDYTKEDFTRSGRTWDVLVDIAGLRPIADLRRALSPKGTLVLVGGEGGGRWLGGLERQLQAMLLSPFVSQKLQMLVSIGKKEDLAALAELIEAGRVTPMIERAYPLAEAAEALRHLEQGHARGKLVIVPG